ncbi:MAG: hypothetical protein KGM97_04460 [Alphaproteobacteria bacterium]|nr:hypothetical protein [Alphaproteobacteria bacterium]MDE2630226.1 hypothetical protein [Alphaproteobacteria bacterium]
MVTLYEYAEARNAAYDLLRFLRITAAVCAALPALICGPARAGAWIPAAGAGELEPMVRYFFADQSFPQDSFSTATLPSTKEHGTQIRLLGEHGLGDGFSLDYDLRYGFLYSSKVKNGVTVVDTNDGLQEQRIGLNYGLTQDKDFADSIGLGVVFPGSSAAKSPALDNGHWAVEPMYRIGFNPGLWQLSGNLDVEPRIFLDGGVTQFRTHLEISVPAIQRVRLAGVLFFVRSARMGGYNDLRDRGELYNLLRLGIEAKFHLTDSIEPVLAYENNVAGMGGHASQRFTFGVKISY